MAKSGEDQLATRRPPPLRRRRSDAASAAPAPQSMARLAILATLLLLAIYTGIAVVRVRSQPQTATIANMALPQRAEALAAHLDTEAASLRGGMLATRDLLARDLQQPIDAAQMGLAATAGAGLAVGIIRDQGVVAVAGKDAGIDWARLVKAAEAVDRDIWLGAADPSRAGLAVVARVNTSKGRTWVVAVGESSRVSAWLSKDHIEAVITPEGQVIAASGATAPGDLLRATLGLNPAELRLDGGLKRGKLADGQALDIAARPTLGGALYAVTAAPSAAAEGLLIQRQLIWLIVPLASAFMLGLLLLGQSRRAEDAQLAFVESEHRFRLAVEAARCGIWEWDLQADQMYMSDVTGAILGWGGGGVASGFEVLERVAPEHRVLVRDALTAAGQYGGFDVSFRVPGAIGASIWIDARGQAFGKASGGYSRIIGVALDVTEERAAQARAQAAESRLRDAIESVGEAFVLWDRQGRLLVWNRNYRSFFSLEARLLSRGASYKQINSLAQQAIRHELSSPDGRKGVREAQMQDGRWLQITERRTAEGGLVMTAADITAIKAQEEARRINEEKLQSAVTGLELSQVQLSELARKYESEKVRAEAANRAKSEFLANMSHELRTPLNAINGFSEIMVQEMFGPLGEPRYKGYSQDILSSGQHLLALINDILDMSKIEAGKMTLRFEPMILEDVADDAVRLVHNRAEAAGLTITTAFPPHLPDVDADYRAIKQVLLNLLSNAIKFTPKGGEITLRARPVADPLGERLLVTVEDNGIGIAAEDLVRLAQPFEQVESQHSKTTQGTGLGLALTKSLVELHGGELQMRSALGIGTEVSFSVPVTQGVQARQVA